MAGSTSSAAGLGDAFLNAVVTSGFGRQGVPKQPWELPELRNIFSKWDNEGEVPELMFLAFVLASPRISESPAAASVEREGETEKKRRGPQDQSPRRTRTAKRSWSNGCESSPCLAFARLWVDSAKTPPTTKCGSLRRTPWPTKQRTPWPGVPAA